MEGARGSSGELNDVDIWYAFTYESLTRKKAPMWLAIQETLHLASIPGMVASIKQGMAEPLGKSAKKLASAGLKPKAQALLDLLAVNPFRNPPPDERLVGDLAGADSRRINFQHRLVL